MRLRRKSRPEAGEHSTIVLGVVYPPGAGGGHVGDEADWRLSFDLRPWRRAGGSLEEDALRLSKWVSKDELAEYMGVIRIYDVVRAEVRLEGSGGAELIELLVSGSDEELAQRAGELRDPLTVEDDFFGTFTFDRSVEWWQADHVWGASPVKLTVAAAETDDVHAAAEPARTLWRSQADWDRRVRARAVEDLLPLKNEHWLEEAESEVTAEQFAARMTLETISVYGDALEFWFDDGGLFLGHTICVSATLADGPNDADIAG
jgi:hypothetical protein